MSKRGRGVLANLAVAVFAIAAATATGVGVAGPASAGTAVGYTTTYVEPVGGPNGSPFTCDPGTACGSASMSGFGHSFDQVGVFNACGIGCHVRTITWPDGSTLVLQTVDQPGPFAFTSPGNAGQNGYLGFPSGGNPQWLDIVETVVGGTGRFAGATGGGEGTVELHGGVAIGKTRGTITLP